mmetsp:Transcript_9993/g.29516  ORF Transcript_9993/g.29516 Transcript_9993/m.29516 type:complete len:286 (+) Transcript_9993:866-1723(+)
MQGRVATGERLTHGLRDQEGDHQAEDVDLELVDRLVHLLVLDVAAPYHVVGKGDGHDHADDEEAEAPGNGQLPLVAHLADVRLRGAAGADARERDEVRSADAERGQVDGLVAPKPGDEVRQGVEHHHLDEGDNPHRVRERPLDVEGDQELVEGVEPEHGQEDRDEGVQHPQRQLRQEASAQGHVHHHGDQHDRADQTQGHGLGLAASGRMMMMIVVPFHRVVLLVKALGHGLGLVGGMAVIVVVSRGMAVVIVVTVVVVTRATMTMVVVAKTIVCVEIVTVTSID